MRSPYTIVKTIPPHSYIDVSENGGEKRYNANNYTEAALKAHLSFNDPSGEQAIVDKIYNFEQDSTYEGQKTLKFYKQSYGILMNRPWRSEYDVTGYTDDDLYAILDVSTPVVDSELEAKIIQEIQKYVYDRSFQGRKFYQFFKDVYEHFFDVKRETSTTSDDSKYTYSELEKHDYNTSDVDKSREKKRQTKSTLLDSRYYEKDASTGELKQLAGNTIDGTNEKLRNELQPIFDIYNVNFVISGHKHAYERSVPLTYNSVENNSAKCIYEKYDGQIYITVGTGGHSHSPFTEKKSWSVIQNSNDYGFLNMRLLDDSKTLYLEFMSNNGKIVDSVKIYLDNRKE